MMIPELQAPATETPACVLKKKVALVMLDPAVTPGTLIRNVAGPLVNGLWGPLPSMEALASE